MPMMSACRSCSRPVPAGTAYCGNPECQANVRDPNAHWSPWRDRGTQAAFRKRLLREFGNRCAAVGSDKFTDLPLGVRCPVNDPQTLMACHARDDLPDLLLCDPHHAATDPHARVRRSPSV